MCGIAGICGDRWGRDALVAMAREQRHRGPDDDGYFVDPANAAGLAHRRLSIIDLSPLGRQPMTSADGRLTIVFNGEIYNYLELRRELHDYPFRSGSDTEVLLAAYERWGPGCLDRLLGMFAFALWDARERCLFAARDRFGVKPFYYHVQSDGTLYFASEIPALWAAGVAREPDHTAWATYLTSGFSDFSGRTFWHGIRSLEAGHALTWKGGGAVTQRWYDLAARAGGVPDGRDARTVSEEYLALLEDSVALRFRSDVPVGINLSGGLDSSTLLALVHQVQGADSEVRAFTFTTGDPNYDELPWVRQMLDRTRHPSLVCELGARDVPALAEAVQDHLQQPYGGLPTLAYARLFERARAEGVIVLLDGQGMDEQWAGYDYYGVGHRSETPVVQGGRGAAVRPACLTREFHARAEPFDAPRVFGDEVANLQYRDTRFTKLPRALRFNDAVSMRASTELREPFLDHRLFELALRQPVTRKIQGTRRKAMLRDIVANLGTAAVVEAPKRPLQTPQREWLRGPLRAWADGCIADSLHAHGGSWLDGDGVRAEWQRYCDGDGDNSFFVWQWITLGMLARSPRRIAA